MDQRQTARRDARQRQPQVTLREPPETMTVRFDVTVRVLVV
jgi:hypothetical protein